MSRRGRRSGATMVVNFFQLAEGLASANDEQIYTVTDGHENATVPDANQFKKRIALLEHTDGAADNHYSAKSHHVVQVEDAEMGKKKHRNGTRKCTTKAGIKKVVKS